MATSTTKKASARSPASLKAAPAAHKKASAGRSVSLKAIPSAPPPAASKTTTNQKTTSVKSAKAGGQTPAASAASIPSPQAIGLTVDAHKRYGPLTEAELLAMPESDYMNKDQLEFFRAKLTELYQHILENATDTGEHLREVEIATDPSDRATQEEEYTIELRTRDRERKLLKKVEKALRMIDEGSFGWCEETGEPIGLARLLARPTATLSIEAQERRERRQKLYGD